MMRRRGARALALVLACAALLVAPAGRSTADERAEVGAAGILWLPDGDANPGPVRLVVALHDLGVDHRGWRYGDQITAAGLAVLHLDLDETSADGFRPGLPEGDIAIALARLAAVLDRLDGDPRFSAAPVGLLAFGEAGQAALLAAASPALRDQIGALVLLYPGCAALSGSLDNLAAGPRASVLLLHGDADPANPAAACAGLADRLARTAPVRRRQYAGAGYAWDLPPYGTEAAVRLPWPQRPGALVTAHFWSEAADMSAAQAASFFAAALPAQKP
jgi:dienelactone hydrolase